MPAAEATSKGQLRLALLLAAFAAALTLALQGWVGLATIYSPDLEAKRLALHQSILTNTPPEGGWAAVGAASLNIRIAVVHAAEVVHRLSGTTISKSYWLLDSVFLFAVLAGLPLYLRRWLPSVWCLVGMLYFAAVLPLTYFLHAYQPWDRLSVAAWLLLLALVRDRHLWPAALVLAVSITVKYDTILIAILWALVHFERKSWLRTALACAVLALVGYATLTTLKMLFPAPLEPARFSLEVATAQLQLNMRDAMSLHLRHPVLLALALPAALALTGILRRPRFMQASVIFGALLTTVWVVFTVYTEVRAQIPLLLLLLPPALLSAREVLERAQGDGGKAAGRVLP